MADDSNATGSSPTRTLPFDLEASVDGKKFASNVAKAIADFFIKGPANAAASGIESLIELAQSFKIQPSPGRLAWTLAISGTVWAIGRSIAVDDTIREKIVASTEEFIIKYKSGFEQAGITIPAEFYDRPTRLPLFLKFANHIIESVDFGAHIETDELRAKVQSNFALAIFEILTSKAEYYAPLLMVISRPAPTAASLSSSWSHYRARLVYEFEAKPVFGQEQEKISLSQLYVPLRGTWNDDGLERDKIEGQIDEGSHIVELDQALSTWIESDDNGDWLRLIGGGPGSGKSTTLKALARKFADEVTWRPLFIPLQNIGISRDLRDAINQYFLERTDASFTDPPLSRESVEDGPPLILIFDGLDELAAPGEAAKDVVATFATHLNNLYASLAGANHRKIKIVVSGRMPAFQAAKRFLPVKPSYALETYGFLPASGTTDGDPLWSIDQRSIWWEQYSKSKGEASELPEALSNNRLSGITNEPLLCYLLALSGYANEHWELAADNRNRIYAALIESIYDRGWGDGAIKRLGPGRTLTKDDFITLMETIALAAWLGGDSRVATTEKFDEAIPITDASAAWSAFTDDNGQDVANLAMNFYLKSSEKNQRGFEFTHKSFGEYLAARALVDVSEDVAQQTKKRPEYALQDWLKATRTGKASIEILSFLKDEFRLRSSDKKQRRETLEIKNAFEGLAKRVDDEGFPIPMTSGNWRELEHEQTNAENALWMMCSATVSAISEIDPQNGRLTINWSSDEALSNVILRLSKNTEHDIILKCLSFIDASNQIFRSIDFRGSEIKHADLSHSLFVGCNIGGNWDSTSLQSSRMYSCIIDTARLHDVDFSEGTIHASLIRNASFHGANLDGLRLSPLTYLSSFSNFEDARSKKIVIMQQHEKQCSEIMKRMEARLKSCKAVDTVIREGLVGDQSFTE